MQKHTETNENDDKTPIIAALNDRLRQTYWGGKVMTTHGVNVLPEEIQVQVFRAVSEFDDFDWRNDPHSEHDFGKVDIDQHEFFWKIDYYDNRMEYGSEDPSNPEVTTRVLTIMLTSEY